MTARTGLALFVLLATFFLASRHSFAAGGTSVIADTTQSLQTMQADWSLLAPDIYAPGRWELVIGTG